MAPSSNIISAIPGLQEDIELPIGVSTKELNQQRVAKALREEDHYADESEVEHVIFYLYYFQFVKCVTKETVNNKTGNILKG